MKYFIDFEATQYSGEVISIGCVDELNREFYSLVKPEKPDELTDFIIELTKITYDELENAPTADEAFSAFLDWIDKSDTAEFYCYGDCDVYFLKCSHKNIHRLNAQLGISLIQSNLIDYSVDIKRHFGIKNSIALKKVLEYYRGEEITQNHNALEDALFLKEVYERSINEVIDECPFPEYKGKTRIAGSPTKPKRTITAQRGNVCLEFHSYGKAADWIMRDLMRRYDNTNQNTKHKICNRIKNSALKSKPYFGFMWFEENNY